MTQKVSLIGGIVSFLILVVLSLLCLGMELDTEGGQGLFMVEPVGLTVEVL
jgi:hypothetical protein